MNLRQLEYFVHVAELGSFSKAALVLDIAQPALSRQVRVLETDLRQTLLLRNGRGVTLTEAGQRLFEHGQAILQAVAQAESDMGASRDAPTGRITVGLPPTLSRQLTLPLIDAFQRRCPQGRLAIVEGLSSHIVEWITTGRVDVGLMYNPEAQPALEITPLHEEALCLVSPAAPGPAVAGRASGAAAAVVRTPGSAAAGPQGPVGSAAALDAAAAAGAVATDGSKAAAADGAARGVALPLAALPRYPLIAPERGHALRRLLETQAALTGVKLQIAWEVSSIAAIIDLVAAGYGHAVLHASAVTASGRADTLVVRPLVQPRLVTVLCLAASAHKRAGPLMRHTTRLLTDLTRALPQGVAAQSLAG